MDNNEIKETKQTIKESVDLAKNVKSGNIIGAAKNAMNLLKSEKIKKKIRLKIILAALKLLLPIMVIVILASSVLSIFTAVTDKMDELKSNITTFTTSVWKWFTNDYWIDIEKEIDCVIDEETGETEKQTLIDQYMSETEKMGISIQKLKLLGDADYTSEEVMNDPKNIALMKKYLKEFIRADLISQEIHRRRGNGPLVNPLNEDEIDGGIYLYRSENELTSGNLQKYRMEYVTQSDFESKIESKPNDLEKYFTIDQTTGELLYPQIDTVKIEKKKGKTWSVESIEKTVTVKKCDYKSIIAKYSLPYEFLTDLCMISQNPEFVYRVALMARTTNISLVILDNETETIDTVEEEITTTTLTNLDSASSEGATSSEKTDEIGTRTTIVQTNPQIVIEEVVDSWIYKGKKTYTNNANKTKVGPSEKNGSVDSKPSVLTDTGKTQSVPVATNNTVGTEFTTYRDAKVYSASYISKHKIITTNEVNTNNFDDGVIENEIIKSDDFLGLLRNKDGKVISVADFKNGTRIKFLEEGKNVAYPIPNSEETIQEMPLNKIISGAEILFHQLRRNSKTVGLEEIMRYLLQFPTQKDYGISESQVLELLRLENSSTGFSIQYDSITGEELEILYKICQAEAGASSESEIGHVASVILNRVKASKWPNTVRGVVFQANQFAPVSNGSFQKAVPSEKTKRAVDSVLAGGDTTGGAVYFRTKASAKKAGMPTSASETHSSYIYLFEDPNTHIFYTEKTTLAELQSSSGGYSISSDLSSLFPSGLPTTQAQVQQYLVTIDVPITTKAGIKTTKKITVHKSIAEQLKSVLQKAQNAGFKVYDIAGYSWRTVAGSSTMSQHSLGLAVDINVTENYCVYPNGKVDAGSFWKPGENEYSIPANGVLVSAFKSIGWGWGRRLE